MAIDPRDATSYDMPLVRDLQQTYKRGEYGDEGPFTRDPYSDPHIRPGVRRQRYRAAPRRYRPVPRQ